MSYEKLANYLSFIESEYDIEVCIKDYCGFIPINKELGKVLQPYLTHTNRFCMYIKHEKKKYWDCLSMIRKMHQKFETNCETFSGTCHAGLREYIIPISSGDLLLGSINVGFFPVSRKRVENRIRKTCNSSEKLKEDVAISLFDESIKMAKIDPEKLIPTIEMLADYLALTYENLQQTHGATKLSGRYNNSNADTIIGHATKIIHENYHNPLKVGDIAAMCHCSESNLSRVFKKRVGINLNVYINKIRVESSKAFLIHTEESMADISTSIGFNDPNYFSKVFTDMTGIPPTEYRRRFAETSDSSIPKYIQTYGDKETNS